MIHYLWLDVSAKETAIFIVVETGKAAQKRKVAMEPAELITEQAIGGLEYARVRPEAAPLSQWLVRFWHEVQALASSHHLPQDSTRGSRAHLSTLAHGEVRDVFVSWHASALARSAE